MGLYKEYMGMWQTHPINTGLLTLATVYGLDKIRKAFTTPEGEFMGIGASTSTTSSTSASHAMMDRSTSGDLMQHPTALFGHKKMAGHCTAGVGRVCTNPHCHCGGAGVGDIGAHCNTMNVGMYGDDTHEVTEAMSGVPSAIRRRVMINAEDSGGYNNAQVSHLFGHNQTPTGMTSADVEAIADMAGF